MQDISNINKPSRQKFRKPKPQKPWQRISQTQNKKNFFLYARKSSEDDDRQVASIDDQINILRRKAAESGIDIVAVLSEAKSAKEPGRTVFNDMVNRIEAGEATGILCWKLDRLARNPIDGSVIQWLLQRGAISHIQTYERSYYPTDNVLMMALEFGMANQFVRDLSTNVKRGLANKVEKGWCPAVAPIGYLNSKSKERGTNDIHPDPERFPIIKKAWGLLLSDNYSAAEIRRILTRDYHLRTRPTKKYLSKELSESGIYRIFTNPFYCGFFNYNGQLYKGGHEPMITEGEFDRAQLLLGKKGRPRPKTQRFPFTGLMRCSCGCMITAEEKTKRYKNGTTTRYVYYRCTKKSNTKCVEKYIEAKELERQIEDHLYKISIPEAFQTWAIKHLHEVRKSEVAAAQETLKARQSDYNGTIIQLQGLLLRYTSPENSAKQLISDEEYVALRDSLQEKKKTLEANLKDLSSNVNEWVELSERTFTFARYATTWFKQGDLETKKAIFSCLGSNFILSGQKVSISLHKPFQTISDAHITKSLELEPARTQTEALLKRKNTALGDVILTWQGR
jgi:site-specific DNA recombinase